MVFVLLKTLFFRNDKLGQSRQNNEPVQVNDLERAISNTRETETCDQPLLMEKNNKDYGTAETCSKSWINSRIISDAIIGLADGLTVPFALTAGLATFKNSNIVVSGGLAELMAGAISMGLGGWLAARSEAESYQALKRSTTNLVNSRPREAAILVSKTIRSCIPQSSSRILSNPWPESIENSSFSTATSSTKLSVAQVLTEHITKNSSSEELISFLLTSYHGASPPSDTRSAVTSAATIAAGYFIGGFVPLFPYLFCHSVSTAFWWSVGVVCLALFAFGAGRCWCVNVLLVRETEGETRSNLCASLLSDDVETPEPSPCVLQNFKLTSSCIISGFQMLLTGTIAAIVAMALVRAFENS